MKRSLWILISLLGIAGIGVAIQTIPIKFNGWYAKEQGHYQWEMLRLGTIQSGYTRDVVYIPAELGALKTTTPGYKDLVLWYVDANGRIWNLEMDTILVNPVYIWRKGSASLDE